MDNLEEWRPVFRQVIYRALCDALGYTNLPQAHVEHKRAVNSARSWFIEDRKWFQSICGIAGMDSRLVRETAMNLIHAKSSGDYTRVPSYWREVFQSQRIPNLSNIEAAIANSEKLK